MNPIVVYYSRGGKTKKAAETISKTLGCKAVDLKKEIPDISGLDLLVVGSGNYYPGTPEKELLTFLNGLASTSETKAAVFATSGGPEPKIIPAIEDALKTKGYNVISSFKCRGRFLFMNWSHPNDEDLKDARTFAENLKNS